MMATIKVDIQKCDECSTCASVCPVGVYEIKEGKSVVVNQDACLVCRACETQCPKSAITVTE
jgi:NAD-dependent dihydropyrimidine dehydrogenase PreA subunit